MNNPRDVLDKLAAGEVDALIGIAEGVWLDAKESPYILDTTKQKLELAKDVSALANAVGGVIVLGFDTTRDPTTAAETISAVRRFPLTMIDVDRLRKLIHEYVYPPLDIVVGVYEAAEEKGQGVASIAVEAGASKPYIVSRMIDDAGQNIGAHFGYFGRKQDIIPTPNAARLQQQMAAGQHWLSIEQRLQAIEANISSWGKSGPPVKIAGIVGKVREDRLKAARIAVQRGDAPLVYYRTFPVWSEKWTLGLSRLIRRGWEKATRGVRAILRPRKSPREMSIGIFELEQAYGCPPQSVRG